MRTCRDIWDADDLASQSKATPRNVPADVLRASLARPSHHHPGLGIGMPSQGLKTP